MAKPPTEFGKRKPAVTPLTPSPPVKRSRHVALLLTGTLAVGGTAYAVMPHENCPPASSAVAGPAPPISGTTTQPTPATSCGSRYSGSGGHGGSGNWWSHSSFYSGSSSSGTSTGAGSTGAGSTTTTRGGFGSFAHLFSGGG